MESITSTENASALTLDPVALIGGQLGQAIKTRAERLQVPTAVLLNGILPAAASQLPCGVKVMLNEDSDFTQPPVIWSLSVAPTGSNKSETSDIAIKPLYRPGRCSSRSRALLHQQFHLARPCASASSTTKASA